MKNLWNRIASALGSVRSANDERMPLATRNYLLLLLGAAVIVLGFVLMSSGSDAATPERFSYDIFSWRRITLAPILVIAGFAFEIYAIMKRF